MALRHAVASGSRLSASAWSRAISSSSQGVVNDDSYLRPIKRLKPPSTFHYTGEPAVQEQIEKLRTLEVEVRTAMLEMGLTDRFGMSSEATHARLGIPELSVPACSWHSAFDMGMKLSCPVNEEQRSRLIEALEKLRRLMGTAALYDRFQRESGLGLTTRIADAMQPFVLGRQSSTEEEKANVGEKTALASRDEYDRLAARGRAKSARATVWIIRTKTMPLQESTATGSASSGATQAEIVNKFVDRVRQAGDETEPPASTSTSTLNPLAMYGLSAEPTIGRVLVNNEPMVDALPDIHARNIVLEPFALTQTLGEYNVFAIATHGGRSSRARAIAHAIARCLFEDVGPRAREVLQRSGLLETDPRVRLRSMPNKFGNRVPKRATGRPGKVKRARMSSKRRG